MTEDVRHRLFIALEVREPARAALARAVEPLRESHRGLRWVDPQMWHVTLSFVGSVPVSRAQAVDAAAARAAANGQGPVDVRLSGGFGSFSGGVLYAAIEETGPLMSLAALVTDALIAEGFEVDDGDYIPHCTLARVPRGCRLPPQLLADESGPAVRWTARQLAVVRSRLRIGGAAHEKRSEHPLGARAMSDAAGT